MNRIGVFVGLLVVVTIAGCGGAGGGPGLKGSKPFRAKILVKHDGSKCVSRTVPRHIDFEKGDHDSFIWTIQDKSNCLPDGVYLELRFASVNPTGCAAPITNTADKNKIECDLGTYSDNTPYRYDVYLIGTGHPASGTKIEDPDIEIVVF